MSISPAEAYLPGSQVSEWFNGNDPSIDVPSRGPSVPTYPIYSYERPEDWPAAPELAADANIFIGLLAVYPGPTTRASLIIATDQGFDITVDDGIDPPYSWISNDILNLAFDYDSVPGDPTSDGFKVVTITVTATADPDVDAIVLINLQAIPPEYPNASEAPWLEVYMASPNLSEIFIGPYSVSPHTDPTMYVSSLRRVWVETAILETLTATFQNCTGLEEVIFGNIGTPHEAYRAFQDCLSLLHAPLFDATACQSFEAMFANCPVLQSSPQYVTTDYLQSISEMFRDCYRIQSIELFDTSNVTDFGYAFSNCSELTSIPLFDTSAADTVAHMLDYCSKLKRLPHFNLPVCFDWTSAFQGCAEITSLPPFNTGYAVDLPYAFAEMPKLRTVPAFNLVGAQNISYMFSGDSSLVEVPPINASLVTDASGLFQACLLLESVEITDLSSVQDISSMFGNCLSLVDVTFVAEIFPTNVSGLFSSCERMTDPPLFDTSVATNITSMFALATSLRTIPAYDFSSAEICNSMFSGCTALQRVELALPSATAIRTMFSACPQLTSVTISEIGLTDNSEDVFNGCRSLVSVDIDYGGNITNASGDWWGDCISLSSLIFQGFAHVTLDLTDCRLDGDALDALFTSLGSELSFDVLDIVGDGTTYTIETDGPHNFVLHQNVSIPTVDPVGYQFTARTIIDIPTATSLVVEGSYQDGFVSSSDVSIGLSGLAVTIIGNPGVGDCDETIATDKGWDVVSV